MIEVPKKAREKALQVLPKGTRYFDDAKKKFLIDQATEEERRPNSLELQSMMLDERIIQAQQFMKDDDFIKSEEFKSFMYKLKQNELSLHVKPRDTDEKVTEMVQKLQAYDPNSESLTIEEARELVQRSGVIVFPEWDISSSFLLDQMRRQEKSISYEDINPFGELQGAQFNIYTKTMAIWSVAPESEKPTLMEIKETPAGNAIF